MANEIAVADHDKMQDMNEDRQNSTGINSDSSSMDMNSNPEISKTIPNVQDESGSSRKSKKMMAWSITGVLAIVILPAVLALGAYLIVLLQGNQNVHNAQEYADGLAKQLHSLVLIDGKTVSATGKVDGDNMSTSSQAESEAYAEGTLAATGTLTAIEKEVSNNLAASGYVREEVDGRPYYATPALNDLFDKVMFRYVKDDKAVRVFYKLDRKHLCPTGYVCRFTPKTKPMDKVYPIASMDSYGVAGIDVTFGLKTNNQTTYW